MQSRIADLRVFMVVVAAAGAAFCQAPLPAARPGFEAASVKPSANPDGRSLVQAAPGRLVMRNIPLRRMILIAWDLRDYQLAGDPAWVGSEHYDVEARADGDASAQEMEGPACGFHLTTDGLNRVLDGKGVTMEGLAGTLSRSYSSSLGRNVVDKTGLAGQFDVHLAWTMDPLSASVGSDTGPSVLVALQEQAGLKLEAARAGVVVIVIDHIEKPSAN